MMAYYLGLEEETLIHSTTWMNFEDIMLSERSPSEKDKYCVIPLPRCLVLKFRDGLWDGGFQSLVGAGGNNCLMGPEFQFGQVLEMVGDGGHTKMWNVLNASEPYT